MLPKGPALSCGGNHAYRQRDIRVEEATSEDSLCRTGPDLSLATDGLQLYQWPSVGARKSKVIRRDSLLAPESHDG